MFLEYRAALIIWIEEFNRAACTFGIADDINGMSCADNEGDPGRPWMLPNHEWSSFLFKRS
jgi:hypothetical protein